MVANRARLRACVRVARKTSHAFSRRLDEAGGQLCGLARRAWQGMAGQGRVRGWEADIRSGAEEHHHPVSLASASASHMGRVLCGVSPYTSACGNRTLVP